jgi:hypothetical protein
MLRYFPAVGEPLYHSYEQPVTKGTLFNLYGSLLQQHVKSAAQDTYVGIKRELDYGYISYRLTIEEPIKDFLRFDPAYLTPLVGLTLHLGGYPCDRTSYLTEPRLEIRIGATCEGQSFLIPVLCVPNGGSYEAPGLQLYKAEKSPHTAHDNQA